MKKHVFCSILVTMLFLMLLFALTSCAHEHTYGEWETEKEATCAEEGISARVCECGNKETKSIDKEKHTTSTWSTAKEATCVDFGRKELRCKNCDAVTDRKVIPTTEHTPGEWIFDIDSTCTENGNKHRSCTICNITLETQTILAIGHQFGEWITEKAPTCTEDGSKHQICSACKFTASEQLTSPGHQYTASITDKTCVIHKCSTCSHEYTENILPVTASVFFNGTGMSIGNTVRYSRHFSASATGGYGKYQYKYEVFSSSDSSTAILTEDFSDSTSFEYSHPYSYYLDTTVLKVTVKDEAGNMSACRMYGSGVPLDSFVVE